MKDAYYFTHDYNARHDPKCKALINKYGIEGYGRFWIIIENLRESRGYKLEEKKYVWESLAEQLKCPVEETKTFIKDCINEFELLIQADGFFYSESLLERMAQLDGLRAKRQAAAQKRWED